MLSSLFFSGPVKKRSRTTLASKGKQKGESQEEPRRKRRRKICQQCERKRGVIEKLQADLQEKTAQLKELGDKVQHYQNKSQKREHASALKEDKLDTHICFLLRIFVKKTNMFDFTPWLVLYPGTYFYICLPLLLMNVRVWNVGDQLLK